jgi:hypothetical protein
MHELVVAAASSLKLPAIRLQELDQLTTLHRVYYTHDALGEAWGRILIASSDSALRPVRKPDSPRVPQSAA